MECMYWVIDEWTAGREGYRTAEREGVCTREHAATGTTLRDQLNPCLGGGGGDIEKRESGEGGKKAGERERGERERQEREGGGRKGACSDLIRATNSHPKPKILG